MTRLSLISLRFMVIMYPIIILSILVIYGNMYGDLFDRIDLGGR